MNKDNGTDWGSYDGTGQNDHNMITDISQALSYVKSENRAIRQRQKLREELVKEHILNQQPSTPPIKSLILKWLKLN